MLQLKNLCYITVLQVCSFLGIGLIFGIWALQVYSEQQVFMTNVALIGICGIILGTILLISGTILFSIANLIRENK